MLPITTLAKDWYALERSEKVDVVKVKANLTLLSDFLGWFHDMQIPPRDKSTMVPAISANKAYCPSCSNVGLGEIIYVDSWGKHMPQGTTPNVRGYNA